MNIVIGISHPKQVYMFKNLISFLNQRGHKTLVLLVDKEISAELLNAFNIPYIKIGQNKKKILNKIFCLIPFTVKSIIRTFNFKPNIFIGQAIPHIAYASKFFNKPFIIFEDTENARYPHMLANPFANYIITPIYFEKCFGDKQIKINGSFEYSYLNRKWFTPQESVLKKYNILKGETFSIVRFVNWTATHDISHIGITKTNKVKAVKEFANFGKVIVSSEGQLPPELVNYKIKIDPIDMHSLMYYAKLLYGESATMAAEAGYIGTPAIFLNNDDLGYTNQLEKYDLVYNFNESLIDQEKSVSKGKEILSSLNKEYWISKAMKFNNDCIDVGSFMIWFVENYPNSARIMKENPDYQFNFK